MAGMNILIADDNATMRVMLEKQIERLGVFDIDFAGNGAEALRAYRQRHHDLMVIDNYMPQLTGVEVLRELRNDPLLDRTHVIMITGQVNKELVAIIRAERLKIDELIVKPVDLKRFQAKVSEVAASVRRRNRTNGPILKEAEQTKDAVVPETTLAYEVIDRGNIAIIELKGRLEQTNKGIISKLMKNIHAIMAPNVLIDINGAHEIDEFGFGTLAVLGGWLRLNGMEPFLSFDDCRKKDTIISLGITNLVPAHQGMAE
jgi:two-component system chemotaxis response regulator CheY